MPFSLSPSVQFSETDLTTSIPAVATSIGAIVGDFAWGAVNERTLITDENVLVSVFDKPTQRNFADWYSAANFLAYSNNLQVVRVAESTSVNAADTVGIRVENSSYKSANQTSLDNSLNTFVAKYPGTFGNDISVDIADSTNFVGWTYESAFNSAPTGTELYVVVVLNGNIVEQFEVDIIAGTIDFDGSSKYADTVINNESRYVWLITANLVPTTQQYILSNGSDGATPTDGDRQTGFDLFSDGDTVDVNLIITASASPTVASYVITNIADTRRDCVAFVSPQLSDVVDNASPSSAISTLRTSGLANSSTYAHMDGNYKYQYDKYNDVFRWIPLNGDCAGLYARTDYTNDPWWSAAGYNRGGIKNVSKLAWNPSKAERDSLYKLAVNPIITATGEGTILFGDKTLTIKPSSFGYMNVRRLFILLEKAISTASKYQLFDFNDTFTQNRFVGMVEPFLRDVKGRRGIVDFLVVADERVNKSEVVDRGEFKAEIYIKPSRSIQNIFLNFIATKQGVAFEELVGG